MQRRRLYECALVHVCMCMYVCLRFLSHLSFMFAQSREFLTSIILSLSSDTLVALSYPSFAALSLRFRRCYQRVVPWGNFPRWKLPMGIMLFYFWLIATRGRRHYSRMNIQRRSRGRKSSALRKLPSRFRDDVRCPSSTSNRLSAWTTHILFEITLYTDVNNVECSYFYIIIAPSIFFNS